MFSSRKLLALDELSAAVKQLQDAGRKVVFTNGCFDIIHPGHILHLQQARDLGDVLVVALNSDESVRQLKGPSRPIFGQSDRALVLAALEAVDYIVIFNTVRATPVIKAVQPDIYVKGGDYTLETLNAEERAALEECGARIVLLPEIEGHSTTSVITHLRNTAASDQ